MDDLISRKEAIDALTIKYMAVGILGEQWAISQCIDAIKKLPSVQSEQKRGKWIRLSNDLAQCSECKDYIDNAISCGYNYCPNCGAIMDVRRE